LCVPVYLIQVREKVKYKLMKITTETLPFSTSLSKDCRGRPCRRYISESHRPDHASFTLQNGQKLCLFVVCVRSSVCLAAEFAKHDLSSIMACKAEKIEELNLYCCLSL